MPLSVLCKICRTIDEDEISQMFAAGLNVVVSEDLVFLIAMAAREIQTEEVRNWALNELQGISSDSDTEAA
ncbi:MAG TPA: hypothetical protein ENH60_01485 [Pricia sp.]|nr:hypothetical protein [Pricia sp.]